LSSRGRLGKEITRFPPPGKGNNKASTDFVRTSAGQSLHSQSGFEDTGYSDEDDDNDDDDEDDDADDDEDDDNDDDNEADGDEEAPPRPPERPARQTTTNFREPVLGKVGLGRGGGTTA